MSKKINITEGQLDRVLKEYHSQTMFNFDDNGEPYFEKNNYQHYVDYLEDFGKYGNLPKSKITLDEIADTLNGYIDNISSQYEIRDMFSEEEYGEDAEQLINDYVEDAASNIIYGLNINDRGLIYIEREISIPNPMSHDKIKFNSSLNLSRGNYDFFQGLKKNYEGNVGVCWSWQRGNGQAYCSMGYGKGTAYVMLKGYVDPQSVNWERTLLLNGVMPDETELRLEGNAPIEVFAAELKVKNGKPINLLKQPIIVKA